jgi:hypothetical protein
MQFYLSMLRLAAIALVLYGLLGFGLLGFAYVIASRALAEVDAARTSLVAQRDGLVTTLRATSGALGEASRTFETFGGTLTEAQRASQRAAQLARDSSVTASGLEQSMYLQFFGLQPLVGLAPGFAQAAEQMQRLGADLDLTAEALGKNQGGVGATGAGLAEVRRRVDGLADAFASTPLLGGPADAFRLFRYAVYGLLLWLAGQAFVSVLLGVMLFRHSGARRKARPQEGAGSIEWAA